VRVGAVRDLNGDGGPELITGADPGGDSKVKVFDGLTLQELDDFFAYPGLVHDGVFVAGRC
jgi:hypothetical protein